MTAKLSAVCSKESDGSYFAICPELKGCFTQGDTYEEALSNIKELAEMTIREDMAGDDMEDILRVKTKIFSEFEITV